jgi:hypothetical protein
MSHENMKHDGIIFQPLTLAAWLLLTVGKAKGLAVFAFLCY